MKLDHFQQTGVTHSEPDVSICGLLLLGGQSRRMGTPKAFLKSVSGETFLILQTTRLLATVKQIVIVCHEAQLSAVAQQLDTAFGSFSKSTHTLFVAENSIIHDTWINVDQRIVLTTDIKPFVGYGPLAGLFSGMLLSDYSYYLALAIDMPYMTNSFLRCLLDYVHANSGYDVYLPVDEQGKEQPLVAVYKRNPLVIERKLVQNELSLAAYYRQVNTHSIGQTYWHTWTSHDNPFMNLNYPDDYRTYIKEDT